MYQANRYIKKIFLERIERNPLYSLRAFARDSGVTLSLLSNIIREKCSVTLQIAKLISKSLNLVVSDDAYLRALVVKDEEQRNEHRAKIETELKKFHEIPNAQFEVVSNWQHHAILTLFETVNFKNDVGWMARRLGISEKETLESLKRLETVGLLKQASGVWKVVEFQTTTSADVPSEAIKKSHFQRLELAAESLRSIDVLNRDFSSFSMAFDKGQMKKAKQMITSFRRRFVKEFSKDVSKATEVYSLSVQFFPLTKIESDEKTKHVSRRKK